MHDSVTRARQHQHDPSSVAAPAAARGGRARELADLLRSRRDRLQPADAGLPAGQRRRTRGLRREEVAHLAGVSTTYYTFLEQARDLRTSWEVLEAIAGALHMTTADRAHLHTLGGTAPRATPRLGAETLPHAVAALVDRLDPYPTYVTGRYSDVLASNRAARLLWTDWPALPPEERNMLWWTFTDPGARRVLVDWEAESSAQVASFGATADRLGDDPSFGALIGRLREASPDFRVAWRRRKLAPPSSGGARIFHPVLGELTLTRVVLTLADDEEQKLLTFAASPPDQDRIAELLSLSPPGGSVGSSPRASTVGSSGASP
jgi:transcriptional regulator with XRE-family HTH domain